MRHTASVDGGAPLAPAGPHPGSSWWRRGLALLVVAALLTAFSETFYWYAGGTDYPARVIFYLIPTTALLWTIARWPGSRWPTVVLAGAVYGFVTEGVLTTVVYGGFPFDPFAISYTALAWHALISVGFGLVLLHRLLASGSVTRAVAAIALFGAFWGVWATTLRLPPGDGDELPALASLIGNVDVGAFALYTVAATAVVGACHLLLGRLVRPADLSPGQGWLRFVLVAGTVWFVILVVPAAPWAPIELAALLALCAWGLTRYSRSAASTPPLASVICAPVPARRLGLLAALPLAAVATYAALRAADPSEDAIRAYLLEPLVAAQTLLGWGLFLAALGDAARPATRALGRGRGLVASRLP